MTTHTSNPSSPHLHPIFTPSSPHLHPIFTPSSPHLHPIFTPSSPHLHPIFTPSSPHLLQWFNACFTFKPFILYIHQVFAYSLKDKEVHHIYIYIYIYIYMNLNVCIGLCNTLLHLCLVNFILFTVQLRRGNILCGC